MLFHIQTRNARTLHGGSIHHCAGCGTIAVNSIRPRAEHGNVFSGDFARTVKRKMLVASAGSRVAGNFHRNFSTGNDAGL